MSEGRYSRREVLELAGKLGVGLGAGLVLPECSSNGDTSAGPALVVSPASWSPVVGQQQQLTVFAKTGDGGSRDVTAHSRFTSGDRSIVSVDGAGLATARAAGSTSISVSYQQESAGVGVSVSATTAHGPDAVVTGYVTGGPQFDVVVPPGTRVAIIPGEQRYGSVWHTGDGAVLIENAYLGASNQLNLFVDVTVGKQWLFSGSIVVQARSCTRPFWYKPPQRLPNPDLSKFAQLAGGAAASMADKYLGPDPSTDGTGLAHREMGIPGERPDVGEPFPEWDADYLTNPSDANLGVVRRMADASAPWPFHAIDMATQKPIDLSKYPRASTDSAQIGRSGNPFTGSVNSWPLNLVQADGQAVMFNVLACALFDTEFDRDALTQWAQYLGEIWQTPDYRLPSGVVMPEHLAGERGPARSLLLLAYAGRYSDRKPWFTAWTRDFIAHLRSLAEQQTGIHVLQDGLSYYNNQGFVPWEHHALVAVLGMCIKLGYPEAQWCLDYFGKQVLDSLLGAPHEFATLEGVVVEDPSGNMAADWPAALQLTAAVNAKLAAALTHPEDSPSLIQALYPGSSAYQAGDFAGYPASPVGHAAMMQGAVAMLAKYATDRTRAQQAWTKFRRYQRVDYSTNPKYDVVG